MIQNDSKEDIVAAYIFFNIWKGNIPFPYNII